MLYLLNSDFTVPAISKFRNFIFFPFFIYTLIQFDKYFVILKPIYYEHRLHRILYFLVFFVFIEMFLVIYETGLYESLLIAIKLRLSLIGTDVGIEAGLIFPNRFITPMLNPVQFSFLLFTFYVLSNNTLRFIIAFVAIVLCGAKSFIVAIAFFTFFTFIRNYLIFIFVLCMCLFMPLVIEVVSTNEWFFDSMQYRYESLGKTILYILNNLNVPIEKNFISLPDIDSSQIFGFESFIGSFLGVTGIFGLSAILGLITFVGFNCYRVTATALIILLFSDNTSSMYLLILPLLIINLSKNTKFT